MNYKETLNLPKTDFPMRAGLAKLEPRMQEKWDSDKLYEKIRKARAGAPNYTLHDGPPYPTGELHLGVALNKVLKDFLVKYHTMKGEDAPYIPGWDMHGLPIEHKVMLELGDAAHETDSLTIRKKAAEYAYKYLDIQRSQFKALGVFGQWDEPYLTLHRSYEAGVLDVFAHMVKNDFVYRGLKPIHWCASCRTALAEAELEYANHTSNSIYVRMRMESDTSGLFGAFDGDVYAMIWTTTPWTLPANLAITVHPRVDYVLAEADDGVAYILAEPLAETALAGAGRKLVRIVGKARGDALEGLKYRHPFVDHVGGFLLEQYVTVDDGTGLVHTAPGHGKEDYITCLRYGIQPYSPLDDAARFTEEAPEWLRGLNVFDANQVVLDHMKKDGSLLSHGKLEHEYPHCWRCKEPVIFRATTQWFVNIDNDGFRESLLDSIKTVNWIPSWGETRITSMVAERPDWCLSRQRHWGVPIPAFYCESCDEALCTFESVNAVKELFAAKGANSWYETEPADILPEGMKCEKCGGTNFRKESDIFDVWFESGSSHRSVVIEYDELEFPCDLYLEGSDQHRGWFQLSLIPSMAAWGKPPFKSVLTHGFTVDEEGRKMSKSLGNYVAVDDVVKQQGADIVRLFIASVDYRQDIPVSMAVFVRMAEAYKKFRFTFRYMLGCLGDFDDDNAVPYEDLADIDKLILARLNEVVRKTTRAFDEYEFYKVYHVMMNFAVTDLSNFYFDVLKDRMYTWAAGSKERRSSQTAMKHVLATLTKLLAPILAHTCEEVYEHLNGNDKLDSVHLELFPAPVPEWDNPEVLERWEKMKRVRDEVSRFLEEKRTAKEIGSSLEAKVTLAVEDDKLAEFLKAFPETLETVFIVSEVELVGEADGTFAEAEDVVGLKVKVERASHGKCQRCWNYRASVGESEAHPGICAHCVEVVEG